MSISEFIQCIPRYAPWALVTMAVSLSTFIGVAFYAFPGVEKKEGTSSTTIHNYNGDGHIHNPSGPAATGTNANAVQINNYGWSLEEVDAYIEKKKKKEGIDYDSRYPDGYAIFGQNDRNRTVAPIKEGGSPYLADWKKSGFSVTEDGKFMDVIVQFTHHDAENLPKFGRIREFHSSVTSARIPFVEGPTLFANIVEPPFLTEVFVEVLEATKPVVLIGLVKTEDPGALDRIRKQGGSGLMWGTPDEK